MKFSAIFLSIALCCSSAIAVGISRLAISDPAKRYENKGPCECPLAGLSGTCLIQSLAGNDCNAPRSAPCEGIGFFYTCGGTYNFPNRNIRAQCYPGNARPAREIIDCPGVNWCSGDDGNTFHKCKQNEKPYHPTFHVDVTIGETTFNVGNHDLSHITSDIGKTCKPSGCDRGTDTKIPFDSPDSAGKLAPTKGKITLEGNADINNNPKMMDYLVKTVGAILQASKQCKTIRTTQCSAKRETPGIAHACGPIQFETCDMANYVQATAYDIDGGQKAQLTFEGTSSLDRFPCDSFLGAFGAAMTAADAPAPIQGGIAVASLICNLITGDKDDV